MPTIAKPKGTAAHVPHSSVTQAPQHHPPASQQDRPALQPSPPAPRSHPPAPEGQTPPQPAPPPRQPSPPSRQPTPAVQQFAPPIHPPGPHRPPRQGLHRLPTAHEEQLPLVWELQEARHALAASQAENLALKQSNAALRSQRDHAALRSQRDHASVRDLCAQHILALERQEEQHRKRLARALQQAGDAHATQLNSQLREPTRQLAQCRKDLALAQDRLAAAAVKLQQPDLERGRALVRLLPGVSFATLKRCRDNGWDKARPGPKAATTGKGKGEGPPGAAAAAGAAAESDGDEGTDDEPCPKAARLAGGTVQQQGSRPHAQQGVTAGMATAAAAAAHHTQQAAQGGLHQPPHTGTPRVPQLLQQHDRWPERQPLPTDPTAHHGPLSNAMPGPPTPTGLASTLGPLLSTPARRPCSFRDVGDSVEGCSEAACLAAPQQRQGCVAATASIQTSGNPASTQGPALTLGNGNTAAPTHPPQPPHSNTSSSLRSIAAKDVARMLVTSKLALPVSKLAPPPAVSLPPGACRSPLSCRTRKPCSPARQHIGSVPASCDTSTRAAGGSPHHQRRTHTASATPQAHAQLVHQQLQHQLAVSPPAPSPQPPADQELLSSMADSRSDTAASKSVSGGEPNSITADSRVAVTPAGPPVHPADPGLRINDIIQGLRCPSGVDERGCLLQHGTESTGADVAPTWP
ncbi:MAG: hypothetical protein WDW36_000523 [Sanguina aurantia]